MNKTTFESKIERVTESGCWIWMGSRMSSGYGDFRENGAHKTAHRTAYELYVAPIPDGLHVLHSCDVPECCNPAHLSVGTNQDNIADSVRKGRRTGPRNRPSGLKYNWNPESKEKWIAAKKKLSKGDIELVRSAYSLGVVTIRGLAKGFGVSYGTMHRALK